MWRLGAIALTWIAICSAQLLVSDNALDNVLAPVPTTQTDSRSLSLLAALLAQEEQALKQQEQALLRQQAENELRALQRALLRVEANDLNLGFQPQTDSEHTLQQEIDSLRQLLVRRQELLGSLPVTQIAPLSESLAAPRSGDLATDLEHLVRRVRHSLKHEGERTDHQAVEALKRDVVLIKDALTSMQREIEVARPCFAVAESGSANVQKLIQAAGLEQSVAASSNTASAQTTAASPSKPEAPATESAAPPRSNSATSTSVAAVAVAAPTATGAVAAPSASATAKSTASAAVASSHSVTATATTTATALAQLTENEDAIRAQVQSDIADKLQSNRKARPSDNDQHDDAENSSDGDASQGEHQIEREHHSSRQKQKHHSADDKLRHAHSILDALQQHDRGRAAELKRLQHLQRRRQQQQQQADKPADEQQSSGYQIPDFTDSLSPQVPQQSPQPLAAAAAMSTAAARKYVTPELEGPVDGSSSAAAAAANRDDSSSTTTVDYSQRVTAEAGWKDGGETVEAQSLSDHADFLR